MIELAEKYYTKEEYFALQEQMEEKIEYHQGRIHAMAGGSPEHNLTDSIYLYSIDKHIALKDIYKKIVGLKEGPFI